MQQKFDVFLNFRGEDVRYSFLSHLLGALNQASLQIFVDYKIKRGDEISDALMSAIENSKLVITIFSKNYATSRWCLNELVKIIECRDNPRIKQILIPVYYHVTSIEVKSQSGSFTKAFTDHENSEYLENRRKVPIWKAAMKRAGGFSGRSVKEKSPEYDVVVDIVNDVLIALGRPPMENKVDGSDNSVRLIHTLELQVKGNIWTPSSSSSTSQGIRIENLDSLLNMLKLQAHPSSSLPLEWNPQTNSSYSQALTYVQTEGSTEWKPQTNSGNSQASKYGQSEGSKSTETSSGPATEWNSKASTYGQSEWPKRTGTSSASVQHTSYPTTEELYLPDARHKVVLFVTSSRIVRVVAEHCDAVGEVLKCYGVSFDERNTSVTSHRKELQDVLKGKPMMLPALFVKGEFIGGYKEIKKLKESGELAEILQDFSICNKIVLYSTSSEVSKKIYDDCREVRMIFSALRVPVDERDTNAVPDYTKELKNLLKKNISLPRVFIRGKYIGGANEIRGMNQTGELKKLVEGFPVPPCDVCGDFPYCIRGKISC